MGAHVAPPWIRHCPQFERESIKRVKIMFARRYFSIFWQFTMSCLLLTQRFNSVNPAWLAGHMLASLDRPLPWCLVFRCIYFSHLYSFFFSFSSRSFSLFTPPSFSLCSFLFSISLYRNFQGILSLSFPTGYVDYGSYWKQSCSTCDWFRIVSQLHFKQH